MGADFGRMGSARGPLARTRLFPVHSFPRATASAGRRCPGAVARYPRKWPLIFLKNRCKGHL
jgi:hypothetical protein